MNERTIDFSIILASSIHDMKNCLNMLLHNIDSLHRINPKDVRLSQLNYDALRVNNYLLQLMALYKIGSNQYVLHCQDIDIKDFLEEQVLQNELLAETKSLQITVEAEAELYWDIDRSLVGGVINNILTNAIRYTKKNICISAGQTATGSLYIQIDDDGPGYPNSLLGIDTQLDMGVDFISGSTGFGLYFSSQVAHLHGKGEQEGHIEIRNGGKYSGGSFTLILP